MKKLSKIISLFIIMFIIISINYVVVFADPNSSKGFLTYTDEQAEEEREELRKAQENNNTVTEVKATNNYLKELSVEGYKITPNFDKQTINYELKNEVKTNSIVIKAEAYDEKATVNGIGEITLNDGENEIRIDVTAESGAVRTYYIKAIKKVNGTNENKEEIIKDKNYIAIIISVILVILILAIIIKKIKHK